ncbi:MAG TPA: hypothetical protein VK665_13115 [Candidatus Elarobacter sp.]|nr:hypothetical protein [Candidatus Elarobacter sp.]
MSVFDVGLAALSLLASLVEPFLVLVGWIIEFVAEHLFGVMVEALTDKNDQR